MAQMCRYKIIFKDAMFENDWLFALCTDEPKTEDEIESLIDYWSEVISTKYDAYTPVDIMNALVADHMGWWWEDWEIYDEEVVVHEW